MVFNWSKNWKLQTVDVTTAGRMTIKKPKRPRVIRSDPESERLQARQWREEDYARARLGLRLAISSGSAYLIIRKGIEQ